MSTAWTEQDPFIYVEMSLETPSSSYIECEKKLYLLFPTQKKILSFPTPSLSHDRNLQLSENRLG